jgi:peptidoglycan/xylan/chitin deacetylase (PgdA/CDA1 family)
MAANLAKPAVGKLPILSYHNVAAAPAGAEHPGLYLRPAQFRWQMRVLKWLGYRGVSIAEGLPYLLGEKRGKVAILTFDDGYKDNLHNALPILREFGFTATCYLVADCIGAHNRWDSAKLGVEKPLMDLGEIRAWLDGGMHVGSHTLSHPHLPQLNSAEKRREIVESRAQLESLLSVPIEHLCYPYGEHDADCVAAAEQAGYRSAVTTTRGAVKKGDAMLSLRRGGNSGRKADWKFLTRAISWQF